LFVWWAAFLCFSRALKPFINFSTTSKQRWKIIFHVARIAVLAEKDFDSPSGVLTSKNFRNVAQGNIRGEDTTLDRISRQISYSVRRIKEIAPSNSFYNDFLKNIIATWETHAIRDVKERKTNITKEDALRSTENRGGLYFLALVLAIQPKSFTDKNRLAVYYSGAWIQIVDDYADQKKDVGKKHTPFTIHQDESLKEAFEQCKGNYERQILSSSGGASRWLIKLIKLFSFLWPLNPI